MSALFVDTSALLPFLDRDDRDHSRVVAHFRLLFEQEARLVTTNYILVEAGALVKARLGTEAFKALGRLVAKAMDVAWIDADLHQRAWDRSAASGKNGPGLVDCTSLAMMQEEGLEVAFSLDRHFTQQGFQVVP